MQQNTPKTKKVLIVIAILSAFVIGFVASRYAVPNINREEAELVALWMSGTLEAAPGSEERDKVSEAVLSPADMWYSVRIAEEMDPNQFE